MIKRGGRCAVPGCDTYSVAKTFSLFTFPKDPTRARTWLVNSRREDLEYKTADELNKSYRICGKHFEPEMFLNSQKRKLQSHAIPTLFDFIKKQTVPIVEENTSKRIPLILRRSTQTETKEEELDIPKEKFDISIDAAHAKKSSSCSRNYKSVRRCLVPGCDTCSTTKTFSFFSIPRDPEKARRWLLNCDREDLQNKAANQIHERICGKHFETKMFLNDLQNRLQPHALPTIFAYSKTKGKNREDIVSEIFSLETSPLHAASATDNSSVNAATLEDMPSCSFVPTSSATESSRCSTPVNCATQTSSELTANSPRTLKLRAKLRRVRTAIHAQRKKRYKKEPIIDDFEKLCDKFLNNPQLAKFVKIQARLDMQDMERGCNNNAKDFASLKYNQLFNQILPTINNKILN